ncbi:MAG: hypothetical protein ACR2HN_12935 [Tepidiformaceae bacterium]
MIALALAATLLLAACSDGSQPPAPTSLPDAAAQSATAATQAPEASTPTPDAASQTPEPAAPTPSAGGGGGGGHVDPTVVPITTPFPPPPPIPADWKTFTLPKASNNDSITFRYPPTWTVDYHAPPPDYIGFSAILTSYDPATLSSPMFPKGAIKIDLNGSPNRPGFGTGCVDDETPTTSVSGRSASQAFLIFSATPKAGEIARAHVVRVKTTAFAYCIIGRFTPEVPESDQTFQQFVAGITIIEQ